MKIVTLDGLVCLNKLYLRPHVSYVLSDSEAIPLYQRQLLIHGEQNILRHCRMTSIQSYERRYGGQDANGKTIALYRHYAYGDSLIASAIPRYIKTLYPHSQITFFTHPEMFNFWKGNAFIHGRLAVPLPMQLEALKKYDYHIMYEGMLEGDWEPNQSNCYDNMFAFCGLTDVPDRYKRPYVFLVDEDYASVDYLRHEKKVDFKKKYLLYHLSPANENRCYPLRLARTVLEMFLKAFPDWDILVVGLDAEGSRSPIFKGLPEDRCKNLLSTLKDFRHLIPLVESANLIICPDSAISHLAACFPDVPTISLWGLFAPDDRVKYYPNQYPIHHPEVCPHAPCHNHEFVIPEALCKDAKTYEFTKRLSPLYEQLKLQWCPVLAAISPEEIIDLADSIINKGYRTDEHRAAMVGVDKKLPRVEKKDVPDTKIEEYH